MLSPVTPITVNGELFSTARAFSSEAGKSASNSHRSKGIRTKIEATELDRRMLLENLNVHDQDH
jgi:hypothetical protein